MNTRCRLKHTPSVVALLAALALIALTIAAVLRPSDLTPWPIGVLAAVWIAVLAAALVAVDRARGDEDDDGDTVVVPVAPPPPPTPPAEPPRPGAHESGMLLEFARELHGILESDRLRLLIGRRLPAIVGRQDVWVVARFGDRQQIIVPPGASEAESLTMISDQARQWATYPMKSDGRTVGVLGTAVPPWGLSGRDHHLLESVAGLVGQALSTADAFETIREASLVDQLTGCAMRAEGVRRFQAELRRADRSRTSLAVMMLDLDHFKSINDRFGHEAGDNVLSAVGQTLLTTLRASDVRCRWGGEEFLLVLPDSNGERARRAAEKLRQRIADTPARSGERIISVTASIGVTLTQPGDTEIQPLLARADAALYQAKSLGRNRVRFVMNGQGPQRRASDRRPVPADSHPGEPQAQALRGTNGPTPSSEGNQWNGPERRDGSRRDRRRFPGPGRRWSDKEVVDGPWRAG